MPKKPRKNMSVTIDWNEYQVLKNMAIDRDTTIKKIVEEIMEEAGVMDEEKAPAQKVYACPECGKEFDEKKSLRGHMMGKHGSGLTDEEVEKLKFQNE